MTGGWRKLYNHDFLDLNSLPNIIRMTKSSINSELSVEGFGGTVFRYISQENVSLFFMSILVTAVHLNRKLA
jgi:hypothetical protein